MNTPTRLGLYGLGLLVAFAGALGVGRLAGPATPTRPEAPHAGEAAHGDGHADGGHDGAVSAAPAGLQVADAGYRLTPLTPALRVGAATGFAFRIVGPDGAAVTRYVPTHERDLHLIVVRRDLSGFQHVHPRRDADGTWRIPLTVAQGGQYRVLADFQPAGRDRPLTLGVDVPAAGDYRPVPLPAPARTGDVDGYRVTLAGDLVPGTASRLTLTVTRAGRPVTDLQPYLGAYGHLVALRAGDLAYLHVHPEATGDAGPAITFVAEVPSTGAYRLFLDFRHGDVVRTAAFTATAGPAGMPMAPGGSAPTGPAPATSDPHGHG